MVSALVLSWIGDNTTRDRLSVDGSGLTRPVKPFSSRFCPATAAPLASSPTLPSVPRGAMIVVERARRLDIVVDLVSALAGSSIRPVRFEILGTVRYVAVAACGIAFEGLPRVGVGEE